MWFPCKPYTHEDDQTSYHYFPLRDLMPLILISNILTKNGDIKLSKDHEYKFGNANPAIANHITISPK